MSGVCIKCDGSGRTGSGEICDCGAKLRQLVLPTSLEIPRQYQTIKYHRNYIRKPLQDTLGAFMEKLLQECLRDISEFSKNYLICAPANSGKTVWAYNLYSELYSRGYVMPEIMDLMQVRELLLNPYTEDKKNLEAVNNAKIMVIKIPMDLPTKFPETISTIIERRVRNGCSTIFMFNGSWRDLVAQDKFEKLKYIEGDGAFNTICVKSFEC